MLSSPTITRQRRPARRRRSSSSCSSSAVQLSPAANFQNNQFQQKQRQLSPQGRRWRRANTTPKELAGLRFLVLSHIDELEKKLEKLGPIPDGKSVQHTTLRSLRNTDSENVTREGSPNSSSSPSAGQTRASSQDYDTGNWDSEFDFSVDDLRTWVHDSLEQLAHLRAEVTARLPDLEDLRPHFDFDFELPNLNLDEFRARLSRIEVPNFSEFSSLSMTDMKTRLGDLGYEYLPTLADHLSHLNSHLTSLRVPDFPSRTLEKGNTVLKDFIDALMYSEENSPLERERVDFEVEQTAIQVRRALSDSAWGNRLLSYHQLPIKWRNNEHVLHGYRFIPLERWPSLLLSAFQLHNETANIHTHLIPAALLGPLFAYEAYASPSRLTSLPTTLFSVFSLLCLLSSVAWHICAGCASFKVMETAARIDYLGIGWLISASIATVVYYSFSCRRLAFSIYLSMNILAGLAGSILPFMQWFNERKHKKWRIVFFLSLALTGFIPVVHLCIIHSVKETAQFVLPIVPSLVAYIVGLLFYAFHFPECNLSSAFHDHLDGHSSTALSALLIDEDEEEDEGKPLLDSTNHSQTSRSFSRSRWTDWVGGGSHAIWHAFIVAAIWLHRSAIPELSKGMAGECCDVWGRM